MGKNIRAGQPELTLPETFLIVCNSCQLPVCTPAGYAAGYLDSPLPRQLTIDGRTSHVLPEPCQWVFEQTPEQFKGHTSIVDRLLSGVIQPPTIPGAPWPTWASGPEESRPGRHRLRLWAHATAPVLAGPIASGTA